MEQAVALGVDHNGAVACADEPSGDPRLRHRLARAGGADDEGVPATRLADGDANRAAALVTAYREPAAVDPAAAPDAAALETRAAGVERAAAIAGVLGPVAAVAQIVQMPARAGRGRESGGGGDEPGRLLVEGPQQRPEEDAGQGPGPVQPEPSEEQHGRDGEKRRGADGQRQGGEQVDERVKRRIGHQAPP
jgi:hypothetical protein